MRFYWNWIFLCIVFWANLLHAQTNVRSSILELRRQQFLNQQIKIPDLLHSADLHIQAGLFQEAFWDLAECDSLQPNSIETEAILFRKGMLYLLTKQENLGIALLENTNSASNRILKILLLNQAGRFEEGKAEYLKENPEDSTILRLFDETILQCKKQLKSEKKARILSSVIPGTGQIYGRKAGSGIQSFILTGGFLGIATAAILNQYYITGIFSGLQFAFRFYKGGIRNAVKNIQEQNQFYINKHAGALNYNILKKHNISTP